MAESLAGLAKHFFNIVCKFWGLCCNFANAFTKKER